MTQSVIKRGCDQYGLCNVNKKNNDSISLESLFNKKNNITNDIKHIHHSIPQQMATFLNLDYNRLVEFLKCYWKWAENNGKPYYHIKTHLDHLHMNNMLYEYINLMKNEYLFGFPDTESLYKVADILIRNSKDIHSSAGTIDYIRFIHNLTTSNDNSGKYVSSSLIDIDFPSQDMFRTSDGKWVKNKNVLYISNTTNIDKESIKYKKLIQDNVSATIVDVEYFNTLKFNGFKLVLEDVKGTFDFTKPTNLNEYVYPITNVIIKNGGSNFNISDTFDGIEQDFIIERECFEHGFLNIGFSGNYDIISTKLKDSVIDTTKEKHILKGQFNKGTIYTITLKSNSAKLYVSKISDKHELLSLEFDEHNPTIGQTTFTSSNNSATIQMTLKPFKKIDSYFKNTDGFLSDRPVLQDSKYYQDYSYEVKIIVDDNNSPDIEYSDIGVPIGMVRFKNVKSVAVGCMMNNAKKKYFYSR